MSEKISQIMVSDRSSHHKMTNPGQNGLSSTFSGKFPIKMLIQTVEREKKKREEKHDLAQSQASVFSLFQPDSELSSLENVASSSQSEVHRTTHGLQGKKRKKMMNLRDFALGLEV